MTNGKEHKKNGRLSTSLEGWAVQRQGRKGQDLKIFSQKLSEGGINIKHSVSSPFQVARIKFCALLCYILKLTLPICVLKGTSGKHFNLQRHYLKIESLKQTKVRWEKTEICRCLFPASNTLVGYCQYLLIFFPHGK